MHLDALMPISQYTAKITVQYSGLFGHFHLCFYFYFFLHSNQQLAQKEKMLKEEVEEMKATLSCTEEGRARASAHSKHVVSQTQGAQRESIKMHSAHMSVGQMYKHKSHIRVSLGIFVVF